jgi:hypothetical protein
MRHLLAALLGGAVALATPALAAPSSQLGDPKGDWAVASQDVLSGRLSSVLVAGKPVLRGELTLAAPPAAGVVSTYNFGFQVGCEYWSFNYIWPGTAQAAQADLEMWSYCTAPGQVPKEQPDAKYAVTFAVAGSTLTWQAPYAGTIRKGAKAGTFAALACPVVGGVAFGNVDGKATEVWTGDIAFSQAVYVIGSDLPRR